MLEDKLKKFNLNVNDINIYFNKYNDYLDTKFFNILLSFLNFSCKKNILGVLKIKNDMYLLICNKNNEYAAIKINVYNISESIFYNVNIYSNNNKYKLKHTEDKVKDHGIYNIENVVNNLFGNIRDVKLEERSKNKNKFFQNYLLVYLPIDYIENNICYTYESNKLKFRAKYKVPLNLSYNGVDDKNHLIEFYIPTIHPISKDDKKDFIIC